jgi:hypothetical protein
MADAQPTRSVDPTDALFRSFLEKVGLGAVDCMPCARALLPWPFDWESYTYTAISGQSWTWDIGSARAFTRGRSQADQVLIDRAELSQILQKQCRVDEQHLHHIPVATLEEPILLAPVPDRQGYAVIDGSHRATVSVRAGRDVHAVLLTPAESMLAIEVAPLAMHRIALELERQGLLPSGQSLRRQTR